MDLCRTQNALPVWHTHSTVTGSATTLGLPINGHAKNGIKSEGGGRTSKSVKEEEDELLAEHYETLLGDVKPEMVVKREPGIEEDDGEVEEMEDVGVEEVPKTNTTGETEAGDRMILGRYYHRPGCAMLSRDSRWRVEGSGRGDRRGSGDDDDRRVSSRWGLPLRFLLLTRFRHITKPWQTHSITFQHIPLHISYTLSTVFCPRHDPMIPTPETPRLPATSCASTTFRLSTAASLSASASARTAAACLAALCALSVFCWSTAMDL